MRIPLQLLKGHLQVTGVLNAPRYRVTTGLVPFVFDTGSDISMIGYGDILRLNIPQNALPFEDYTHMGGGSLGLHSLRDIALVFEDDTGKTQRFALKEFFAGFPTKKNEVERERAKTIPSILGLNFLIINRLSLYCNPIRSVHYLEAVT